MVFCFLSLIFQSSHRAAPSSLFRFRSDCLPCITPSPPALMLFRLATPPSSPSGLPLPWMLKRHLSTFLAVFALKLPLLNVNNLLGGEGGKFENDDMILSQMKCVIPAGSEPLWCLCFKDIKRGLKNCVEVLKWESCAHLETINGQTLTALEPTELH